MRDQSPWSPLAGDQNGQPVGPAADQPAGPYPAAPSSGAQNSQSAPSQQQPAGPYPAAPSSGETTWPATGVVLAAAPQGDRRGGVSVPQPPPVDDQRTQTAGIRKLQGRHLVLYTDVPSTPAIDELPQVFDLAVPQWCAYFGVAPAAAQRWVVRACVMQRHERFVAAGLLPEQLPAFLNGYALDGQLWLLEQPSDYYRRHLLLHEGTHAFMQTQLRGMGPPWFSEGLAELLATHRWEHGRLELHVFPQHREEVPYWGRIKIVRDDFAAGRAMSLEQITRYGPTAHLQNEPYGWCWAAAAFLDGHPDYRARFRRLPRRVGDSTREFDQFDRQLFRPDQRQREEQWQLFVAQLDYGYDLEREAIEYQPHRVDQGDSLLVTVRADRGWQSTGLTVAAGTTCRLSARGRYQLAQEPRTWWCEPDGVTIDYYQGHPLGILLAAVSDQDRPIEGLTPLATPQPIGAQRELLCATSGTLFLRVNDAPNQLADNAGQLEVEIRADEAR